MTTPSGSGQSQEGWPKRRPVTKPLAGKGGRLGEERSPTPLCLIHRDQYPTIDRPHAVHSVSRWVSPIDAYCPLTEARHGTVRVVASLSARRFSTPSCHVVPVPAKLACANGTLRVASVNHCVSSSSRSIARVEWVMHSLSHLIFYRPIATRCDGIIPNTSCTIGYDLLLSCYVIFVSASCWPGLHRCSEYWHARVGRIRTYGTVCTRWPPWSYLRRPS